MGEEAAGGKRIVITGGTGGIGLAAAAVLAAHGARLAIVARSQARAERAVSRIRGAAGDDATVDVLTADLSSQTSVRQLARDYETDSGGAGEYRGNCGSLYRKEILVPATVYTYVVGKRYPMPGIAGGRPGSPNRLVVRAGGSEAFEVGERAEYVPHAAGERYEYHYGGGGGWGDPLERAPEKVLDDVLDELVSVEGARRDYGVALRGSIDDLDLAIDWAETERLRKARLAPS